MPNTAFYDSFADEMADNLLVWTQGFQVGSDRMIPPAPDAFAADIAKQVTAFGIAFPGSSEAAQAATDTVNGYASWYKCILLKKLPMNSPQVYIDWYDSTHPVTA